MAFPDPVTRRLDVGGVAIGGGAPLALICGPCVIESPEHTLLIAERVAAIVRPLGLPLIFKASFDKANRSSVRSYRGPGMEAGLAVLAEVKRRTGLPVLTDIHERQQAEAVAAVVDMIQIPAFLARQTDLLLAAAATGRPINVKKGQFMAPEDMRLVVGKLVEGGCEAILLTERGASFGYHRLVSDFRSLPVMRATGWPVCFDATHSVQLPSGAGEASGGQAELIPYLARAATAVGIDALFVETHDDPARALSDGPNALPLDQLEPLLRQVLAIQSALRSA